VPSDLESVLEQAWSATDKVPGHLQKNEAIFLGVLAACVPCEGAIVEIGSFKGRSTVMLAKVAAHYGGGPVVAIDPHNSSILLDHSSGSTPSSFQDFLHSVESNGVRDHVEPHLAYSTEVAKTWNCPIRILWIDGDHTFKGAKADLDAFLPFLVPNGVVAFHDALNQFPGPIRVFVEQVLASDHFGPSGFVHSIAWAQYRPQDGVQFKKQRSKLHRAASRLIPFVESGNELRGMRKRLYKFNRFRVPHWATTPQAWCESLELR